MEAIILAGGFGSRIMPLSYYKPKPMLPVANVPVIDYTISQLYAAGVRDFTFSLGYKPNEVLTFVSGYHDINKRYVSEVTPLGTAGGVKMALPPHAESFIVASADTVSALDLKPMIERHKSSGALITIAVTPSSEPERFGAVSLSGDRIIKIREKDVQLAGRRELINTGTYIISRRALDYVPDNQPYDFARDLFPLLIEKGERLCAYEFSGYWRDMGNLSSYFETNYDLKSGGFFAGAPHLARHRSYQMCGSLVARSAIVSGHINNCIIGEGAIIATSAHLDTCIVLPGEIVTRSASGNIIGGDFCISPYVSHINFYNLQNSATLFSNFKLN